MDIEEFWTYDRMCLRVCIVPSVVDELNIKRNEVIMGFPCELYMIVLIAQIGEIGERSWYFRLPQSGQHRLGQSYSRHAMHCMKIDTRRKELLE